MTPEKNLHVAVPTALLTKMEQAAAVEHISVDELIQDAVESRLNRKEWQNLLVFGERHAKARNLTESDLQDAIAAVRSGDTDHGR